MLGFIEGEGSFSVEKLKFSLRFDLTQASRELVFPPLGGINKKKIFFSSSPPFFYKKRRG